ncbi:sensor histidine kinase [Micromonospora sp. CPCC 206061]|uniref:sensor histidine kinase n=1 Tax=Micromonospora sp. CPCC 206061 TaxID=3122410 RepID=UPI002FF22C1D
MTWVIVSVSALVAVLVLALPGRRWRRYRQGGVAACAVAVVSLVASLAHTGAVIGLAGGWLLVELFALALLVQTAVRWAPITMALAAAGLGTLAAAVQPARMLWGATPPPTRAEAVFLTVCWATVVLVAAAVGGLRRLAHRRRTRMMARARREERYALAGDLHDLVAHDVTGIVLEAQASQAEGGTAPDGQTLSRIEQAGLQALAAIDRTVDVLRDDDAPRQGIYRIADLPALIGRFGNGRVTVRVDLAPELPGRVPREIGDAMYRLVAEALTNVRRHAPSARVVSISGLVDGDNILRFAITDAGATARRAARWRAGRGGFGLVGLAARIEALGGTLHAAPTADGWSVTAALPLPPGKVGTTR